MNLFNACMLVQKKINISSTNLAEVVAFVDIKQVFFFFFEELI